MTGVSEVVITAPDNEWLTTFTRDLLNNRLCASVHIDPIQTMYWWSDEVRAHEESRAILHTRTSLVSHIVDATRAAHPYEVPCVAATAITHGNPDYLSWVLAETREPS